MAAKKRKAKTKPAKGATQGPIGNTTGVYIPVPKPNTSGGVTKIPIEATTPEEKSFLETKQEQLQGKIDDWVAAKGDSQVAMAGGALATALNQVLFPTALWELVPVGKVFKLIKKGKQAAEAALEVRKVKKVEKTAEEVKAVDKTKDAKKAGGKDGGHIESSRMKKHEVRCFKKNKKGSPEEYDRQLAEQERGLNDLSAKDYLEGRERYKEVGRQGTGKAQEEARAKFSSELTGKFKDQLVKQGVFGDAANQQAAAMAAERMKTLAALHNPDMIAGGKDVVTSMGNRGVNSSIGAQWKDRVAELDKAAEQVPEHERGKTKMNAKLKRCKKGGN